MAAAVLATGVLMASQGFSLGARSTAVARQYTEATLLAQARLAELMLEPDLETVETGGTFEDAPLPNAAWTLTMENTDTSGLVRLTVTVSWGGAWGGRNLSLTALCPDFNAVQTTTASEE